MTRFIALIDACVLVPISLMDTDPGRVDARFRSMNETFLDACTYGWEPLVAGLTLPDENDRHVLAAAIRGQAEAIVTNLALVVRHPATVPVARPGLLSAWVAWPTCRFRTAS